MSYIVLLGVCLAFVNIYPVIKTRTMIYESKHAEMQNRTAVVASALSSFVSLNAEDVEKVMFLLGDMELTRVVISDNSACIVYDSTDNSGNVGRYAMFPEIVAAIKGKTTFRFVFTSSAVRSCASTPIMCGSKQTGAVYLYEYSTESAELLMALRKVLLNISAAALVTAVLIAFLLSGVLRKRLLSIVKGIKSVAKGEYAYRIETKSSDEFDELAKEFNIFADRLEQTEMVRQRFVSDASHELKTPLAGIRLLTDSIIQNEDIPPDLQREFVLDIGREAERLTRITEKLLALTRLDFKREEEVHPVDVKTVIIEAMKMLSMLASNKGVTLQRELDDGCIIIANSDDIHEIVFNLVENAIKYNVENGTVRIILYNKGERVHIIIDDTGIGIPEEDIPHIFDRFYRVDKSRTNEIGGSGLGLAIVKDTVEKHAGVIKVQRREAGGTRFEVSFPLYGGEEAAE